LEKNTRNNEFYYPAGTKYDENSSYFVPAGVCSKFINLT
jgi:hypothetical protein